MAVGRGKSAPAASVTMEIQQLKDQVTTSTHNTVHLMIYMYTITVHMYTQLGNGNWL